jgi:deoxyribose-phosphate aldolase
METDSIVREIAESIGARLSAGPTAGAVPAPADVAGYIDHTILKPEATPADVAKLCDEAVRYGFAAVCVNSVHIGAVAEALRGSGVKACSVVGFPLGAMSPAAKAEETRIAVADGADEIDMVINIGALKADDMNAVYADIREVVQAARGRAIVKVIIETCLLTDEEKIKACAAARLAGADFVKTSTGFSTGGATAEDVRLMRATVGPDLGVKASGGIRTYEDALRMIGAGATRLGTSAGVSIVKG